MPHPNLIVQDQFGHYYRLHRGWFMDAPLEPEHFSGEYFAERFVRDLRVDADDWIRILYEIDGQPRNTYNDNVYQDMAVLIVRGHMNVYRIAHLDPFNLSHPAQGLNYPIIKDPQGASYHLVPTSLLLTHPLEGARFFERDGTDAAQRFLDSLNLSDQQIQDIADSMSFFWWVRPRGGATPKSLRWNLGYALEQSEIAVIREAPAQATTPRAAEPDLVPATGPGNRSATLGPHVGSETVYKQDEKTKGSGTSPTNPKQTSTESQATVDSAINSIKGSTFASTEEGKKVVSKIDELNTSGKIKFESMSPSTRGKWSGSEIVVNANFSADIDATASELVHEATHALHEDEYPASKRKITIDEEMRTNQNQLALYEDQRKGGFRDPELEQRRNDQANGKLRDNVRRRYPGTPEHL